MTNVPDNIAGDGVFDDINGDLKSDYMSDAEHMAKKLDTVSSSFCLAKWTQVSIHLTNGHTQSCYHPKIHPIPLDELKKSPSALHNTCFKKEQRKKMIDGVRPAECEYCWKFEDTGHLSDRHYRSGEPFAAQRFDEVVAAKWDADFTPSYVEVNFNQACNLKCSYCSPHLSSSWQAEIDQFGPYPTLVPHNSIDALRSKNMMPIPNREHNPYVDAFWEWWPDLYTELKVFRMTGGEPLMDKNTYRVMDWIIDHPKKDLELSITSNLSVEPALWKKFISKLNEIDKDRKVDHFMLFVSVDNYGDKAEYIRNGLDFNRLKANVVDYLSTVKHGSLTFIVTYSLFSVFGFRDFLKWVLELRAQFSDTRQKIWFDTPVLDYPAWQSVKMLPKEHCLYVEQDISFMQKNLETRDHRLKGFKDYEVAKLKRVLDQMQQHMPKEQMKKNMVNFYRFFSEHDHRRNTDLLNAFPELQDFWQECVLSDLELTNEK